MIIIDLLELNKRVPSYMKRINSPQKSAKYSLHIYRAEVTQLTKGTKRKKAITSTEYKRANSSTKGYKNLEWLNKMYSRKLKEQENLDPSDRDKYYKVIVPEHLPKGYKLYDHKGEYYATIIDYDEVFYYVVIKKSETAEPFEKKFVDRMFIQGQCGGKYGFTIPLEFLEGFERIG